MSLQDAQNFMDQFDTCVIATVGSDGQPEAATVGFWVGNDFSVLFGTNSSTRKYKNLKQNPAVALVVGYEGKATIQLEGVAKEMSRTDIEEQLEKFMSKVPAVRKYDDQPGQAYFLISPTWLRYTDYSAHPSIFETKDF